MGSAKNNSGLGYNRKPVAQFHWELKSSTLQAVCLCWPSSCCILLGMAWAATTINHHLKLRIRSHVSVSLVDVRRFEPLPPAHETGARLQCLSSTRSCPSSRTVATPGPHSILLQCTECPCSIKLIEKSEIGSPGLARPVCRLATKRSDFTKC